MDGIFVAAWTYRVTDSIVVQPKRIGLKRLAIYYLLSPPRFFPCSQWDDVCVERFPSLFSLSFLFFSILWPDNKFFYFCPSLSKLKYKSMSLHYVLLYIFFLQKEELSFSSREGNLFLSLSFVGRFSFYSGILSMVDWDRKCSFSWKSSLYFLTRKISSADQRMTKQSLWLHRRASFFEISDLCISLLLSFFLFGCFIFGTIK